MRPISGRRKGCPPGTAAADPSQCCPPPGPPTAAQNPAPGAGTIRRGMPPHAPAASLFGRRGIVFPVFSPLFAEGPCPWHGRLSGGRAYNRREDEHTSVPPEGSALPPSKLPEGISITFAQAPLTTRTSGDVPAFPSLGIRQIPWNSSAPRVSIAALENSTYIFEPGQLLLLREFLDDPSATRCIHGSAAARWRKRWKPPVLS